MPYAKPISDLPVFSHKDILNAYKDYDASPEAKETVLYFVSELTGISVDALMGYMEG